MSKFSVQEDVGYHPGQTTWWILEGKGGKRVLQVPSWIKNGKKLAQQVAKTLEKSGVELDTEI